MAPEPAGDLALEYFRIANGIVAFHVVQTILFLNSIPKSQLLNETLARKPLLAHLFVWFFTLLYGGVILGCGLIEYHLRASVSESAQVLLSTGWAIAGRLATLIALAAACSLIVAHLKAPVRVGSTAPQKPTP